MIKTIIFDWAGVLTTTGFRKGLMDQLQKKFQFDDDLFLKRFAEHEHDYMVGKTSSEEFWQQLCAGMDISFDQFAECFKAAYQWNDELLNLIRKLKSKYAILVLSDNFDLITGQLRSDLKIAGLFDKIYFSNEIKLSKISPEAFHLVLKENNLVPQECLFIDDKERNTAVAAKLGMQTFVYKNFEEFNEYARLHLLQNLP